MVLTHKSIAAQKKPIVEVPYNPKRLFMSRADVEKEEELERQKNARLQEAKAKIEEEFKSDEPEIKISEPIKKAAEAKDSASILMKKKKLEDEYNSVKGPGSKQKREKLARDIADLESQLPAEEQF